MLDCGSGTGSTALLAAQKVGSAGKVVLFDLSDGMLNVAKDRAVAAGVWERLEFQTGDILDLPFEDSSFDVVLSTYSICPLHDPAKGALELYRVIKPGGRIGIAHSAEPDNPAGGLCRAAQHNAHRSFGAALAGSGRIDRQRAAGSAPKPAGYAR